MRPGLGDAPADLSVQAIHRLNERQTSPVDVASLDFPVGGEFVPAMHSEVLIPECFSCDGGLLSPATTFRNLFDFSQTRVAQSVATSRRLCPSHVIAALTTSRETDGGHYLSISNTSLKVRRCGITSASLLP